jgi:hypothetical protein
MACNRTSNNTITIEGSPGPQGPIGPIGPSGGAGTWVGAYSATTDYVLFDTVFYNGSSYICISPSTGNLPTDTTYWSLMAQKGDTGSEGPIGPVGPEGPQGEIGPTGPEGPEGAASTVPGPAGADGAQGPQGEIGPQGPAGADGAQGPQGEIGPQGPAGADGDAADIAAEVHAATSKDTPDDADEEGYLDSTSGAFSLVKRTWANTKAALKTYFDTLYAAIGHTHTGFGDLFGPASCTDNAVARFDGTTGKLVQNSTATIDDDGSLRLRKDSASTTWITDSNNVLQIINADPTLNNFSSIWFRSATTGGYVAALTTTLGSHSAANGPASFSFASRDNSSTLAKRLTLQYSGNIGVHSTAALGFTSNDSEAAIDTSLSRDAAAVLAQRNGTTAQTSRIYNTWTNASNYERAMLSWGSNLFTIGTESLGTGTARDLEFNVGGYKLHIKTDGTIYTEGAGTTLGNARGAGAFDFQSTRGAATRVASGTSAIILGSGESTASGIGSMVLASYSCTASATESCVICSQTSSTAGQYSLILGGYSNVIPANYHRSACIGGTSVTNPGYACVTLSGTNKGTAVVFSHGRTTTDATPTILYGDTWYTLPVPASGMVSGLAYVSAYSNSTDDFKCKAWKFEFVLARNAGTTIRVVGTPTKTELAADAETASWDFSYATTTGGIELTVTGEAGTTIKWQASYFVNMAVH